MTPSVNTSNLAGKASDARKLIAVIHADMVGYSRLIGLDDAGTLRRALIDPSVREHGGRIVQTAGGSLLIVFDSIEGPSDLRFTSSGTCRPTMETSRSTGASASASASTSATLLPTGWICMAMASMWPRGCRLRARKAASAAFRSVRDHVLHISS